MEKKENEGWPKRDIGDLSIGKKIENLSDLAVIPHLWLFLFLLFHMELIIAQYSLF